MRDPALREFGTLISKLGAMVVPPEAGSRTESLPAPTHPIEFYKSRSLAASNWGALLASEHPLRQLTPEEARETVLRGLLDTPMEKNHRNPFDWAVSLAVHVAIIAALVFIPLAFTQALDSTDLKATYLSLPTPPAPAPPPTAPDLPVRRSFRRMPTSALTMPTVIPRRIVEVKDEEAPEIGGGVAGGIAGGEAGGVLGGVVGGTAGGPAPPPSPPKKSVHRVGGDVKPPRQLVRAAPVYPMIAQTAQVEGIVEVDAVIDEQGNVVQARAVSGPKLLYPAALEAVLKWKYEPTYLDGIPESVQMEVQVVFQLRH